MAVDVPLDAVAGELADDPARDSPDGDRRQQRRREEANREPGPAAPPQPLATEVAARLPHRDTAVWGVRHQDHAVDRDLPRERPSRLHRAPLPEMMMS
jgi:hypothetical protein